VGSPGAPRTEREAFGKFVQVQRIDRDGLAADRDAVGVVARAEGLEAHARLVEIRFRDVGAASGTAPAGVGR